MLTRSERAYRALRDEACDHDEPTPELTGPAAVRVGEERDLSGFRVLRPTPDTAAVAYTATARRAGAAARTRP